MDPQLKRGFVEACVLAAVREQESYGYLIIRDVPEELGLTESTLYPVLKRLEAAGLVTARSVEHNGRLRKYYCATEAGAARLLEASASRTEVERIYDYIEGHARPREKGKEDE